MNKYSEIIAGLNRDELLRRPALREYLAERLEYSAAYAAASTVQNVVLGNAVDLTHVVGTPAEPVLAMLAREQYDPIAAQKKKRVVMTRRTLAAHAARFLQIKEAESRADREALIEAVDQFYFGFLAEAVGGSVPELEEASDDQAQQTAAAPVTDVEITLPMEGLDDENL